MTALLLLRAQRPKGAPRPSRCRLAAVFALLFVSGASLAAAQPFHRGDVNVDERLDISDAVTTLGFLFLGSPPTLPCFDAADSNDDGKVDISDPTRTLGFLFLGSPPPPVPFGPALSDCGDDPTPDDLDCQSFAPCAAPAPPGAPTLSSP